MSAKPWTDFLIAALLLYAPFSVFASEGPKEDQEPPQLFYFDLDGKKVPIELNKPFQTAALGGSKTVSLRVEPYRVFRYSGLLFHYPREYTFDAKAKAPGLFVWTLAGTTCQIMVQRYEQQGDHEAIRQKVTNAMAALYKDAKKDEHEITLKLKNTTLKGTRLEVLFAETLVYQDLYSFGYGKSSVVLIVQDMPEEKAKASADKVRAEKMLYETLRLPDK